MSHSSFKELLKFLITSVARYNNYNVIIKWAIRSAGRGSKCELEVAYYNIV